ncbi:hypothetical protein SKAU_G00242710 [Synaphobranchus kaupii]|uniref:Uncharacterized protein n=1 Tax=Synaphobranchus kaupii TaxID=118154 RepID=A0A9Q1ITI1_SYNKA|nr:hypothetical protein SKAU_G00242710 [Synaphobranchus kaupii]
MLQRPGCGLVFGCGWFASLGWSKVQQAEFMGMPLHAFTGAEPLPARFSRGGVLVVMPTPKPVRTRGAEGGKALSAPDRKACGRGKSIPSGVWRK